MPFDRLIAAIDNWALAHPEVEIFAQIGHADYRPRNMPYAGFLPPDEFRSRVHAADFLVSHAGTGSIFAALTHGKPILIVPRRAALRETRNDHQVATAERFKGRSGILVAMDEVELIAQLDLLRITPCPKPISPWASPELLDAVRAFVFSD
mgnify:CR=1 FL=1